MMNCYFCVVEAEVIVCRMDKALWVHDVLKTSPRIKPAIALATSITLAPFSTFL